MKRFIVNVTPKQKEMLQQYANYSDVRLNETLRKFIDTAGNDLVQKWLIDGKNCEYKQYVVCFEDGTEISVDDILVFSIETMDGGIQCY